MPYFEETKGLVAKIVGGVGILAHALSPLSAMIKVAFIMARWLAENSVEVATWTCS
jgi:hypothetical protein